MVKNPSIRIRNLQEQDISAFADLMRLSWREHCKHSDLMDAKRLLRVDGAEKWTRKLLTNAASIMLVAEQNEAIVGSMAAAVEDAPSYYMANKQVYVWEIVVAPEYRGQGVALALEKECETIGKKKGADIILGDIYPFNVKSRKLMQKLGRKPAFEVWYKELR